MEQGLLLIHCIFNPYNNPVRLDLLFSPFTDEETEAQKSEMSFRVTQLVSGRGFEPRVYTINYYTNTSQKRRALQAGNMA